MPPRITTFVIDREAYVVYVFYRSDRQAAFDEMAYHYFGDAGLAGLFTSDYGYFLRESSPTSLSKPARKRVDASS